MSNFADILGYKKQVEKIKMLCDYLKNTDKYKNFGAKIPEGVLIFGEVGAGKTLFAHTLAAESGRNIRFPSNNSGRAIKKAINKAKKCAPSVLIFDDLDCYPEETYPLIDKFLTNLNEDDNVFIISTVTDIEDLPDSLLSCNAFDERVVLNSPDFEDAKIIFGKFFSDKNVSKNFNIEDFCLIAQGLTQRDVESIYNEAVLYAAYENLPCVAMEHVFKAAMKYDNKSIADEFCEATAYHEVGHAVINLLQGGEAAYIVITSSGGQYVEKRAELNTYQDKQNNYVVTFAGNACEELFMGGSALGGYSDLGNVSHNIEQDNKYLACQGFEYYDSTELNSPAFNDALAKKVQSDMQAYYDKAKNMLKENKPLIIALVDALKSKNYLLHSEIHKIFNDYKNGVK